MAKKKSARAELASIKRQQTRNEKALARDIKNSRASLKRAQKALKKILLG